MANKSASSKIREIKDLFNQLYFFDSREIDKLMEKVQYFPNEGLDKMIKLLKEGEKQQNKFLKRSIEKDPNFLKEFYAVLNHTADVIAADYEKKEKVSAEKILEEI